MKMRIAQITRADSSNGGSNKVACQLVEGLRTRGVQSELWARYAQLPGTQPLYGRHKVLFSRIKAFEDRVGLHDFLPLELNTFLSERKWAEYDLFHFHSLTAAISPFTLKYLGKKRPVVWTFHDCSPLTAGCISPLECQAYKTGCRHCDRWGAWPMTGRFNFSGLLHRVKRILHESGRVVTIAPSRWLADLAVESGVVTTRPTVIPNGVDINVFRPHSDKKSAKSFLSVGAERLVVVVSAAYLSDKNKGVAYAMEAIKSIRDLRPFVLFIGNSNPEIEQRMTGVDHLCTGYVSDEHLLSRLYALGDVFVNCSLADNFPLNVLEMMACGVPTVGFGVGGIPELVDQGVTGFLVPPRDQDALNTALRQAIETGRAKEWGSAARARAVDEFSLDRFIERHMALYGDLVKSFAGGK